MSHKKSIRLLMLFNIWYFLLMAILFVLIFAFSIQVWIMKKYGIESDDTDINKVIYLIWWVLTDIPGFSYAILNAKNIQFKDWIVDVMLGYKVINHYGTWSIFIKRSQNYIEKEENKRSLISESNADTSFYDTEVILNATK